MKFNFLVVRIKIQWINKSKNSPYFTGILAHDTLCFNTRSAKFPCSFFHPLPNNIHGISMYCTWNFLCKIHGISVVPLPVVLKHGIRAPVRMFLYIVGENFYNVAVLSPMDCWRKVVAQNVATVRDGAMIPNLLEGRSFDDNYSFFHMSWQRGYAVKGALEQRGGIFSMFCWWDFRLKGPYHGIKTQGRCREGGNIPTVHPIRRCMAPLTGLVCVMLGNAVPQPYHGTIIGLRAPRVTITGRPPHCAPPLHKRVCYTLPVTPVTYPFSYTAVSSTMTVPSVDQVVTVINQLQSIVELVSYKWTLY
jgi:hypothetical protein